MRKKHLITTEDVTTTPELGMRALFNSLLHGQPPKSCWREDLWKSRSLLDGSNVFRVLIVDDSPLFRQTLKEMLQVRFPSVDIQEATDGEKARQKIKNSPPSLIFMDINLPGENGLVLTQTIKAQYPNIVITLLTGWNLPEYREASIQCKADHFLFKGSATKEEIFALVESASTDQ